MLPISIVVKRSIQICQKPGEGMPALKSRYILKDGRGGLSYAMAMPRLIQDKDVRGWTKTNPG